MEFQPSHCRYCGEKLDEKFEDGKQRPFCPSCKRIIWQNASPVAAVVLRKGKKILMVKRGIEPDKGKWSLPAGFLEHEEEPSRAAVRELEEETGLKVDQEDLELLDSMNIERFPGQRLVGVVFSADISDASGDISAGDDADEAAFWSIEQLEESDEELRDHFVSSMRKALR